MVTGLQVQNASVSLKSLVNIAAVVVHDKGSDALIGQEHKPNPIFILKGTKKIVRILKI